MAYVRIVVIYDWVIIINAVICHFNVAAGKGGAYFD